MIGQLAFRNIAYRPWRSLLLFVGYGIGVAVMIVLLSIGEAMLSQARNEKLVGGGTITVLPEGLDIEVMKTGGIGGLFFSIDHASFLYRQVFASPRYRVPSATRSVGAAAEIVAGKWENDEGDRRWSTPSPPELINEIDHFHLPSDSVANRDTWAEWHYFNVLSPDQKRWAFISFIIGGDVTGTKWGGKLAITLREQNGATRRFGATFDRSRIRFSTADANLVFGDSRVTVLPDGDYDVRASAREENGSGSRLSVHLRVRPAPYAYFPGISMRSGGFISGYTVPALRASAMGTLCVDGKCDQFVDAQAYHDHNWGVWRGVTWDWGASRAGQYTLLYGRVYPGEGDSAVSMPPALVYLIDSLGFRAVFRPKVISYDDGRTLSVGSARIRVPSHATFEDARGNDTLRVDITIEDAIATDTRPRRSTNQGQEERGDPLGSEKARPYFVQMKGTGRISGRLGGQVISGVGAGFFETYR